MDPAPRVTIRPARLEDAEAINAIRRLPSSVEFTYALPDEPLEVTRRFLASSGPDEHRLVAELDGRVVGLSGLHRGTGKRRHSAAIGLGVHDEFQGRGIGRRLLEALLDLADNQLGLARVELEVMADNTHAIRLYEA